ncbi:MAG: hypothetical protein SP1CHLAM54_03280 [Chlamydiia bacterium]|nr:hypothetical protein [Chlamydiia bacterium]MCH9615244.1 hypothetical protein [Chlamydiia bacterium]MCH9628434.1 hypothetical protein [Chlamydiia bacterium]
MSATFTINSATYAGHLDALYTHLSHRNTQVSVTFWGTRMVTSGIDGQSIELEAVAQRLFDAAKADLLHGLTCEDDDCTPCDPYYLEICLDAEISLLRKYETCDQVLENAWFFTRLFAWIGSFFEASSMRTQLETRQASKYILAYTPADFIGSGAFGGRFTTGPNGFEYNHPDARGTITVDGHLFVIADETAFRNE